MSLICKCDMCGKIGGMVPFSNSPVSVVVDNYVGHKMRIMVDVKVEHENFIHNASEFKKLFKDYMTNVGKGEQSMETVQKLYELHNKINSPDTNNPLICDQCKKTYAYQILSKGFTNTQNVARAQLTDVDWQNVNNQIDELKTYYDDNYYDEDDEEDNYDDYQR